MWSFDYLTSSLTLRSLKLHQHAGFLIQDPRCSCLCIWVSAHRKALRHWDMGRTGTAHPHWWNRRILSCALRHKSNVHPQQVWAIVPFLADSLAVLCHPQEDTCRMVGSPDMTRFGSSHGQVSQGISAKGKETCLSCCGIWGWLKLLLTEVLLTPHLFCISPWQMGERKDTAFQRCK